MKKFLAGLIVLVVLGGVVFFFGWVQLAVPPGSYGVLRSKTHGVDPQVIREGDFRWEWYALIPTNARVDVFAPRRVSGTFRQTGELPSGSVYASLAGLDASFSWDASGDYGFSIVPAALPRLVEREKLTDQESLEALEDDYSRRIAAFIPSWLTSTLTASGPALSGDLERELGEKLAAAFPELENIRCSLQLKAAPDYALYQSAKSLYEDYIARQHAVLQEDLLRDAETRMSSNLRMDELARYGELLTKYPILMQYLALER